MANRISYNKSIPKTGVQLNSGHPLSQGLVGYWLLNEMGGNKAYDISGRNVDGTLTNGPIYNNDGLIFDGNNDYVKAGVRSTIQGFPFTLCGWVRNTVTDTSFRTILCIGSNTANRGWFTIQARPFSATTTRFGIAADNNDLGGGTDDHQNTTNFSGSTWHFVVGVFASATDRRLYIDGNLLASQTTSVTFNAGVTTGSTFIGALNLRGSPFAGKYWLGQAKNLRIYNRALTQNEIMDLYVNPYAGILVPKRRNITQQASAGATTNSNFFFFFS